MLVALVPGRVAQNFGAPRNGGVAVEVEGVEREPEPVGVQIMNDLVEVVQEMSVRALEGDDEVSVGPFETLQPAEGKRVVVDHVDGLPVGQPDHGVGRVKAVQVRLHVASILEKVRQRHEALRPGGAGDGVDELDVVIVIVVDVNERDVFRRSNLTRGSR